MDHQSRQIIANYLNSLLAQSNLQNDLSHRTIGTYGAVIVEKILEMAQRSGQLLPSSFSRETHHQVLQSFNTLHTKSADILNQLSAILEEKKGRPSTEEASKLAARQKALESELDTIITESCCSTFNIIYEQEYLSQLSNDALSFEKDYDFLSPAIQSDIQSDIKQILNNTISHFKRASAPLLEQRFALLQHIANDPLSPEIEASKQKLESINTTLEMIYQDSKTNLSEKILKESSQRLAFFATKLRELTQKMITELNSYVSPGVVEIASKYINFITHYNHKLESLGLQSLSQPNKLDTLREITLSLVEIVENCREDIQSHPEEQGEWQALKKFMNDIIRMLQEIVDFVCDVIDDLVFGFKSNITFSDNTQKKDSHKPANNRPNV